MMVYIVSLVIICVLSFVLWELYGFGKTEEIKKNDIWEEERMLDWHSDDENEQ